VAAVDSIGAGSSIIDEGCLASLTDGRGVPAAAGSAVGGGVSRAEVVSLPAVTFSFDDEGRLLKSTAAVSSIGSTGFSSATGFDRRQADVAVVAVAAQKSKYRAEATMGASVDGSKSTTGSRNSSSVAVAVAERPQSMLDRIANYSRQQQQQASDGDDQPSQARASQPSGWLFNPDDRGSSDSSSSSTIPADGGGRWRQQQQQQPSEWQHQQQQQLRMPPKAYVGQPVLRVSNKLRYGVVLAVCENDRIGRSGGSSRVPLVPPAAAGTAGAGRHHTVQGLSLPGFTSRAGNDEISSIHGGSSSGVGGSRSSTPGSSVSLLCVIMSGGTNPDHPWRMPDYRFYQHLLDYATESGWGRPGQSDLHARIEEFEFCRDGRCAAAACVVRHS
jgi:hypothetical protein